MAKWYLLSSGNFFLHFPCCMFFVGQREESPARFRMTSQEANNYCCREKDAERIKAFDPPSPPYPGPDSERIGMNFCERALSDFQELFFVCLQWLYTCRYILQIDMKQLFGLNNAFRNPCGRKGCERSLDRHRLRINHASGGCNSDIVEWENAFWLVFILLFCRWSLSIMLFHCIGIFFCIFRTASKNFCAPNTFFLARKENKWNEAPFYCVHQLWYLPKQSDKKENLLPCFIAVMLSEFSTIT